MKQPGITLSNTKEEKEADNNNASFFKNMAMGGPGLNALIQFPDLKLIFVNHQFEHYLGYANEDIKNEGIYLTDLFEENQSDRFLYQLRSVKEDEEAQSMFVIYRLKNRKGSLISFYLYAALLTGINDTIENGADIYHIILHPVHSKWNIPFTSFVTKELFLEHFNSNDFGTFEWIIDIDKIFWSIGVYRIYEIEDHREQVNILFEESLIHPADRQRVGDETRKALNTGEELDIEFKIITDKEHIKIIHCLARTVKNNKGKTLKFAGSLRDVTNQRMIEEDLKNNVQELYHSNKELEEFAYVASHDLQEPLRKISIFSDRLSDKYKDALTGDGAKYLTRMIAAADNMRSLIDDLLQFSKISKNSQPFELVKLDDILKQVSTELELTIEETATTITTNQLPEIEAIPSQMKQLFTNIIGNAIKFHKPGVAPVIKIEAGALNKSGAIGLNLGTNTTWYKVQVTDNGVGFEEEYALRIFQVFQRLHGKSEYPGSGIGLAICKKIVEFHKGIIYAENIPGEGSRFVFILPRHQQPTKGKSA